MAKKKKVEELAQVPTATELKPVIASVSTDTEMASGSVETPQKFEVTIGGAVYWADSEEGARQLVNALTEKIAENVTKKTSKKVVYEEVGDFKGKEVPVPGVVFPSEEQTIVVAEDADYGGAHSYRVKNCLGFNNGQTEYNDQYQIIQFVQKNIDGSIVPGIQSEQLILMLIDRHKKLNRRFPSEHYYKMLQGLNYFLEASRARVEDRLKAGTMGELKK